MNKREIEDLFRYIEDNWVCELCGKLLKDHTEDEAFDCADKLLDSVKEWDPDLSQIKTIEESLAEANSRMADKDSEELLIKPLQIRLKLRELYWKIRAEISAWFDYIRYKTR